MPFLPGIKKRSGWVGKVITIRARWCQLGRRAGRWRSAPSVGRRVRVNPQPAHPPPPAGRAVTADATVDVCGMTGRGFMGGICPPSSEWGEFTSQGVSLTARYAHASSMWGYLLTTPPPHTRGAAIPCE